MEFKCEYLWAMELCKIKLQLLGVVWNIQYILSGGYWSVFGQFNDLFNNLILCKSVFSFEWLRLLDYRVGSLHMFD